MLAAVKRHLYKYAGGILSLTLALLLVAWAPASLADPLRSNNYLFQETTLGGLGNSSGASANFQQSQSSGAELGLGTSASGHFQIQSGNTTTNDPTLAFAITSGTASFPDFSAASTSTATATFQVADYTSYGYVVQIVGTTPGTTANFGTYNLRNMNSTGPSQQGVEQFGINLVANTSPVSLGANPDHGQFGFGNAASNYNTTNNYRYVSGDTIVTGPKSSGVTTYTISYIINVSTRTPGGKYTGSQTIICTGTY